MSTDTIIAIILAILGFISSYYFYRKSLRTKEPCFAINNNNLISGFSSMVEGLDITYKNKQIENLSISKVMFWNNGNETIDKNDIAERFPVMIAAEENVEILDIKLLKENSLSSSFSVKLHGGNLASISFDYIDKQQGAIFQLIHTGTERLDIYVVGDIKGANKIEYKYPERRKAMPPIVTSVLVALMWMTVLLTLFIGEYPKEFKIFIVAITMISTATLLLYLRIRMRRVTNIPRGLELFEN